MAEEMIPFRYVEFYDVPRCLALRYKGRLLLLQSAFDDQLDEYPSSYSVYLLPDSVGSSLTKGIWDFLENTPLAYVGKIAIDMVSFDPTRRKSLDASCLDKVVFS